MSEKELEEIRRRKMAQYQAESQQHAAAEEQQRQFEQQKNEFVRKIMSPEARMRLNNLKMVPEKKQFAEAVEMQLIQMAQTGQLARSGIQTPISDAQLKQILIQAQGKKRDVKIQRI